MRVWNKGIVWHIRNQVRQPAKPRPEPSRRKGAHLAEHVGNLVPILVAVGMPLLSARRAHPLHRRQHHAARRLHRRLGALNQRAALLALSLEEPKAEGKQFWGFLVVGQWCAAWDRRSACGTCRW